MKNSITKLLMSVICLLIIANASFSQKGHHPRKKAHHKKIVRRSSYRPKKVVVYHPTWAPKRNYNRRWVYFPRYNFYWDNWRNMYVYRNGSAWIHNSNLPPTIINVNIENEKHYELNEAEDDLDEIYNTNDQHSKEYKAE